MIILRWLLGAIAIVLVTYLVPGIHVDNFLAALLVALVLGFLNAVGRPILVFLTLPVTILTLGLFIFIINGVLLLIAAQIVPGFSVDSFGAAVIGAIVLAIIGWGLNSIFGTNQTNQ